MKILDIQRFPARGPPVPAAATGRWRSLRGHLCGRTDLRAGRTQKGSQVACATKKLLAVLDTRTGALRRLLRVSATVKTIVFDEGQETAYLADDSSQGRIFRWAYGRNEVDQIGSTGGQVEDLKVSPDGAWLGCALQRKGAVTLSLASGEVQARLDQPEVMGQSLQLYFSPDGSRLVTLGEDYSFITQFDRGDSVTRICSWHLPSSRLCCRLERDGWKVRARGFLADGQTFGLESGTAWEAFDAESGEARAAEEPEEEPARAATLAEKLLPGTRRAASPGLYQRHYGLHPGGTELVAGAQLFDLRRPRASGRSLPDANARVSWVRFTDGGRQLIRSVFGEGIQLLSKRGKILRTRAPPSKMFTTAHAPDGSWAAWALKQRNPRQSFCEVLVTAVPRFEERQRFVFGASQVQYLEASPDSRWLVVAGKNKITGHDLTGGEEPFEGPELDDVSWFRVSPGAELLALVRRDHAGIYLVESRSGVEVDAFEFDGEKVACMAFSPEGRYLAVGLGRGSVQLIDLRRGHEVATLVGHYGSVRWMQFASTGMLCTAGEEGSVLCWDRDRITASATRRSAGGHATIR